MSRFKLTNRQKVTPAKETEYLVIVEYTFHRAGGREVRYPAQHPKGFSSVERAEEYANKVLLASRAELRALIGNIPNHYIDRVVSVAVVEYAADGSVFTYDITDEEGKLCPTSTGK